MVILSGAAEQTGQTERRADRLLGRRAGSKQHDKANTPVYAKSAWTSGKYIRAHARLAIRLVAPDSTGTVCDTQVQGRMQYKTRALRSVSHASSSSSSAIAAGHLELVLVGGR